MYLDTLTAIRTNKFCNPFYAITIPCKNCQLARMEMKNSSFVTYCQQGVFRFQLNALKVKISLSDPKMMQNVNKLAIKMQPKCQ